MAIVTENHCRICLKLDSDSCDIKNLIFLNELSALDALKLLFNIDLDIESLSYLYVPRKMCKKCESDMRVSLELRNKALETHDLIGNMEYGEVIPLDDLQKVQEEKLIELPIFEDIIEIKEEQIQEDTQEKGLKLEEFNSFNLKLELPKKKRSKKKTEKKYSCQICDKTFSQRNNMLIHFQNHTGVRPFTCNFCSKTFVTKKRLEVHEKIHTNDRPYSCYICNKTFVQKSNMEIHIKTHRNEKPYKCSICHQRFVVRKRLEVHERIHTGEKPFSCTECRQNFGRKKELIKHQKLIHESEDLL